jgi:carbamoyltransferase
MPANILGLSCHYHDSAACLMREGRLAAAAQEERFDRRKNSADFPRQALNYCLQAAGLAVFDLDAVVFYEKPYLAFARVLISHLRAFPRSYGSFRRTMPLWLADRLALPVVLQRETGFSGKTLFIKHHLAHAASAFLLSPFEEAAILTADAVGEWATMTRGNGHGSAVRVTHEIRFPDSLGLLYTAVTTFLGFEAHEGEGKVMGLAGLGRPVFLDKIKSIVALRPDGSFSMDQSYFDFYREDRMYSRRFVEAFGKPRQPGAELEERHCDLAASLQAFVEEAVICAARDLQAQTKTPNLCLAGGLFLNCVMNQKILEATDFKNLFVQPAAGDAGGALGACAFVSHSLLGQPRDGRMDPYLGPEYPASRSRRALTNAGLAFRELSDEELYRAVAQKVAAGQVVGWCQGRMELGPRALGNRSILGDPRNPAMKEIINEKVKQREPFRPYAPAVLEENASEYFHLTQSSPFMLLAPRVREEKKAAIPAVTHVDGTARVQTVSRSLTPRFWSLIHAFADLTGLPMVINTSMNLRGEPIVCSPEDAVSTFQRSRMDALVLGNLVVERGAS